MPQVLNKKSQGEPAGSVYIGRPTSWGNPFTHLDAPNLASIKVASREDAVKAYELMVQGSVTLLYALLGFTLTPEQMVMLKTKHEWIHENLIELEGLDLVCWCAPLACHGDVLLRLANPQ